ncbi:response regulator transcription factor [Eubacteriales bacterium OttesenSCG-928-A19]|nr:response regulator transcription factor [Eubacteriales bacterium OttesenSCG-928-A19]
MHKILVADDDGYIRELVSTLLKDAGFSICEAVDGQDALRMLGTERIDLCVLDIMMPGMDGFEFCRQARRYYEDLPILMLTAKADISQKVKGFDLGADDYLTKPFEGAELVAWVRALLKRYKINASQVIEIGALTMDKASYRLAYQNGSMDIPRKEFELLFMLGAGAGRTFTRDQLIEDIWGYDFEGNERTLDVHIGRLRERFPQEAFGFKITTIRGLGYRLEVTA